MKEMAFDAVQFRKVLSRFATGVAVVTTSAEGQVHGMTCNAFCSISISPMSVLVSLAKHSRTERMINDGGVFAVNVLSESQKEISERFAGKHKDKEAHRFQDIAWTRAVTGAPILLGTQAYLDCRVSTNFDGGTHTLFVGTVVAVHAVESQHPLIFFQSKYMGVNGLKLL